MTNMAISTYSGLQETFSQTRNLLIRLQQKL